METNTPNNHTEEFYDVASRLPDSYTKYIVYGLFAFVIIILILSFIIEVPESVVAEVRVTSINPPITLKAENNGKIILMNTEQRRKCKAGVYIAVIENAADYKDVQFLKEWIKNVNIWGDNADIDELLKRPLVLGNIETVFYDFKTAFVKYHLMSGSRNDYEHSMEIIDKDIAKNKQSISNTRELLRIYKKEKEIKSFYVKSDSILYKNKAITKDAMDNTIVDYLGSNNKVVSARYDIENAKQSIEQNNAKKEQLVDQELTAMNDAKLQLSDSFQNLIIQIRNWEKHYAFIAPQDCMVEFANILSNGSFVTVGEPIFNVIYQNNKYYGTAVLPADGAGKVNVGDSTNIKMSLYPYLEYGVLRGVVKSISLNTIDKDYLVYIDLPNGLRSDNNVTLSFAETMYGHAEIITDKQRLIFKFLNKLKALTSSNKTNNKVETEQDKGTTNEQQYVNPNNNDNPSVINF